MATKRRKIEVHRLTISGLEDDASYVEFLRNLRGQFDLHEDATQKGRTKSHVLWDCVRHQNGRLRMRFISFSKGFRPDILDTEDYEIGPTPLEESQTGVEWTHCLAGESGARFLMLVEKHQGGIYPRSIETYLNWMIGKSDQPRQATDDEELAEVLVSLEAEPGEEFIARLDALTRIKAATYRIVRPNPGWADLENELGTQAADSQAHKADISMNASRGGTLNRVRGIIAAIRQRFQAQQLDYAQIDGERDGRSDKFNTEQLGRHAFIEFETDAQGQIDHGNAWRKLNQMFDGMP